MRLLMFLLLAAALQAASLQAAGSPWVRHTIDDSSRGADGVRMVDVNGDGHLDITTGWEEGGRVRVYLNPGPEKAKQKWPAVTVGEVASPEDAVFADLDGDGADDVISSTEGKNQTLYVHWAPFDTKRRLDSSAWKTEAIPASKERTMWMFALPFDIDGKNGIDFFAGSKSKDCKIGWWQSPENPRRLDDWTWHPLYDCGWVMSLILRDMDSDGDQDLVATDRKGDRRGVLWLENPGKERAAGPWKEHRIGSVGEQEVMFMTMADLDGDGVEDVVASVSGSAIQVYFRRPGGSPEWEPSRIEIPAGTGTGKAVAVADFDLDGRTDVAFTCENAVDGRVGAMWLSYRDSPRESVWAAHPISGPEGVKFDRIELVDLDHDGDLDLITCEERDNLGVIWYENPAR